MLVFDNLNVDEATGTFNGIPFKVLRQRKEFGNVEYGVVEGNFTFKEREEIYFEWLRRLELKEQNEIMKG